MSILLGSNLSHKQFIFAEAYLATFNADEAARKAYPKIKEPNGYNIMKSRKVTEYIRARLEEKKATIVRITDKCQETILKGLESNDNYLKVECIKQAIKLREIELRIQELESRFQDSPSDSQPLVINITPVHSAIEGATDDTPT